MNKEFFCYTISDLIIELIESSNERRKIVKDEICSRMKYCGFDDNTIGYFISYEKAIVNKKTEKLNEDMLINKYYWYKKNIEEPIFCDADDYILIPNNKISSKALLTCEILCIIDEANILRNHVQCYNKNVMHEINYLGNEDFNNWIYYEFYNRLENEYRFANNITSDYKGMYIQEIIDNLYYNEMGIIMINRWKNIMPEEAIYVPYK